MRCIQLSFDILCAKVLSFAVQNNQNPLGARGQLCNTVDEAGARRKAPEQLDVSITLPPYSNVAHSSGCLTSAVTTHPNRAATRVRAPDVVQDLRHDLLIVRILPEPHSQ